MTQCPECQLTFHSGRSDQTYCGATCRKRANRALKAAKARAEAEADRKAKEELAEAEFTASVSRAIDRRPAGANDGTEISFLRPPTTKPGSYLRSQLNLPKPTPANPGWSSRQAE